MLLALLPINMNTVGTFKRTIRQLIEFPHSSGSLCRICSNPSGFTNNSSFCNYCSYQGSSRTAGWMYTECLHVHRALHYSWKCRSHISILIIPSRLYCGITVEPLPATKYIPTATMLYNESVLSRHSLRKSAGVIHPNYSKIITQVFVISYHGKVIEIEATVRNFNMLITSILKWKVFPINQLIYHKNLVLLIG